ncbi:MAG: AbrB/MazE/SpoVT family DNA-binding domain-containing protein [Spirochaetales bacterium]|nr:AbrB/MazE/SpoVT family DNA-binding domain-containing protein [Spirochaetales bacterium]
MEYAKVFTNGGSQAVRIPKTCRFGEKEVLVKKIGNAVLLMQPDDPWATMLAGLELFTDDFLKDGVEDLPVQERQQL